MYNIKYTTIQEFYKVANLGIQGVTVLTTNAPSWFNEMIQSDGSYGANNTYKFVDMFGTFVYRYVDIFDTFNSDFLKYEASFVYFKNRSEFDPYSDSDIQALIELNNYYNNSMSSILYSHDKEWSELYKIVKLSDDAYSITDNYSMTEKETTEEKKIGNEKIDKYNDDHNSTKGVETSSYTHKQSPYDNESFFNDTKDDTEYSERVDAVHDMYGERNKTNTNNGNIMRSLERKGNIGIKSTPQLLQEHKDFWSKNTFMQYIFSEIAKEMLYADLDLLE